MAHFSPHSFLQRYWRSLRRTKFASQAGFTLTELLVAMFIASGILGGLMYLVTELTSTNQREAARNETQRDMQNALDYIAADLREATFIYTGDCLSGKATLSGTGCPGILNSLPASLNSATSTPVLAFWKNDLLPATVRQQCAAGTIPKDTSGNPANCSTGHAYSLIVYSINTGNPNGTWKGRARITRYELAPFNSNGAPVVGYIPPATNAVGDPLFRKWPKDLDDNLRTAGTPVDTSAVLVDFVDQGLTGNAKFGESTSPCPSTDYAISPSTAAFRSFYACVLEPLDKTGNPTINEGNQNVDVVVYLRGNAYGKAGIISQNSFLTGLETRVFTRSSINRPAGTPEQ